MGANKKMYINEAKNNVGKLVEIKDGYTTFARVVKSYLSL